MTEKLTVIACDKDVETGGYRTLLSNGTEVQTTGAYPAGVEYVEPVPIIGNVLDGAPDMDSLKADLAKMDEGWRRSREHNDMLRSELDAAKETITRQTTTGADLLGKLDEANGTIASLSMQNGSLADEIATLKARLRNNVAPVPPGLIGVTTANVENLPSIDQLPQHEPMDEPVGALSQSDQRDVEEHLARKRATTAAVVDDVEGTKTQR